MEDVGASNPVLTMAQYIAWSNAVGTPLDSYKRMLVIAWFGKDIVYAPYISGSNFNGRSGFCWPMIMGYDDSFYIYLSPQEQITIVKLYLHEVFHQFQYYGRNESWFSAFKKLALEYLSDPTASFVYNYDSTLASISTLMDIPTYEDQAQSFEDTVNMYYTWKGGDNSVFDELYQRALILYNSGIRGDAVMEVINAY